jgi:hypothetical protein
MAVNYWNINACSKRVNVQNIPTNSFSIFFYPVFQNTLKRILIDLFRFHIH